MEPTDPSHRRMTPIDDDRPDPGHQAEQWLRIEDPDDGRGASRRAAPVRRRDDDPLAPKERRGRERRAAGAGSGAADAREELVRALGSRRGARANDRLRDAAHAFERERFEEARGLLRPIAEAAPGSAGVRELLGLTYYRLGRWKDAIKELEAFRDITRTVEQNPVLADAQRALGRHQEVEALWDDLREVSPSAELMTEGRIVMAGSLADRGQIQDAIDLLQRSLRGMKRPRGDQLRQSYALADLYERAGEVARARELFHWIASNDPGFVDAAERAADLT